jgi:hypothetical protein
MAPKKVAIWRIKKFDTALKGCTLINVKSPKCLWGSWCSIIFMVDIMKKILALALFPLLSSMSFVQAMDKDLLDSESRLPHPSNSPNISAGLADEGVISALGGGAPTSVAPPPAEEILPVLTGLTTQEAADKIESLFPSIAVGSPAFERLVSFVLALPNGEFMDRVGAIDDRSHIFFSEAVSPECRVEIRESVREEIREDLLKLSVQKIEEAAGRYSTISDQVCTIFPRQEVGLAWFYRLVLLALTLSDEEFSPRVKAIRDGDHTFFSEDTLLIERGIVANKLLHLSAEEIMRLIERGIVADQLRRLSVEEIRKEFIPPRQES